MGNFMALIETTTSKLVQIQGDDPDVVVKALTRLSEQKKLDTLKAVSTDEKTNIALGVGTEHLELVEDRPVYQAEMGWKVGEGGMTPLLTLIQKD